ncbi:hypothetical protein VTK73DRAFT_423 [Phialemonium thermophilum]|uniref:6-phosphogluconolactonase n=1 Tax=Phialemonium thermophilum TaxID=223376 RepID=A0ABR3VV92_9PEZI
MHLPWEDGVSSATLLYVASYAGNITTLNLTLHSNTSGSLHAVSSTDGCAPNPSWLTLDRANSTLYCLDEGLNVHKGTLSSYKTSEDGTLARLDKVDTIWGPVYGAIYGSGGRGLALAEYLGSSVTSYSIADPAALALVQAETFHLPHPGVDPVRQDAAHPHEALVDPTGQFLVVPDLGSDLVRIFSIDSDTLKWTELDPLVAVPGSGPRHGAFLVTANKTFYFLVTELSSTLTTYEVQYNSNKTLTFHAVYNTTTHGGPSAPPGASGAEIHISPDSRFLIVSSRAEGTLSIPNFDRKNGTKIPSDPLFNFEIDPETGALHLIQTFPAGGMIPRQFSINKAGTLLAVGLQQDGRVVVISRDPASGWLTSFVGSADVEGQITCALFDE